MNVTSNGSFMSHVNELQFPNFKFMRVWACGLEGGGRVFKRICQLPFLQPNALCGSDKVLSCSYRLMKDDGKLQMDDIHSIPYAAFILSWNLWDPLQNVELLVNLSNYNKAIYQYNTMRKYHLSTPSW